MRPSFFPVRPRTVSIGGLSFRSMPRRSPTRSLSSTLCISSMSVAKRPEHETASGGKLPRLPMRGKLATTSGRASGRMMLPTMRCGKGSVTRAASRSASAFNTVHMSRFPPPFVFQRRVKGGFYSPWSACTWDHLAAEPRNAGPGGAPPACLPKPLIRLGGLHFLRNCIKIQVNRCFVRAFLRRSTPRRLTRGSDKEAGSLFRLRRSTGNVDAAPASAATFNMRDNPMVNEGKVMEEGKAKALQAALAQIEKQFGKGSIMKMDSQAAQDVQVVSTGSLGLDIALGVGGLPRGRVVEIYGPESSGKTTLTLSVIAQAQKLGGT